jgi:hypothetical protein
MYTSHHTPELLAGERIGGLQTASASPARRRPVAPARVPIAVVRRGAIALAIRFEGGRR